MTVEVFFNAKQSDVKEPEKAKESATQRHGSY